MKQLDRTEILDVSVDVAGMGEVLDYVDERIRTRGKTGYIVAINPEKVYQLRRDSELKKFSLNADVLLPDGIGIVLGLRLFGHGDATRVPGADLMQKLCERAAEKGHRVFIYGSSEESNREAAEELKRRYPGLQVAGRSHGYVPKEEYPQLVQEINESGADILFVALGSPKQEEWIRDYAPELNVAMCQGIGGTLDTISGHVERAPAAFRACGLEWFYRLLRQPSRWRRQTVLLKFVVEILRDWMSSRLSALLNGKSARHNEFSGE